MLAGSPKGRVPAMGLARIFLTPILFVETGRRNRPANPTQSAIRAAAHGFDWNIRPVKEYRRVGRTFQSAGASQFENAPSTDDRRAANPARRRDNCGGDGR
jgi:hypothetical protein